MQTPNLNSGRSLGLKLIIVCVLVVLMAIPAMFISYISFERSQRANDVTAEVSKRYGGEQYVAGPILVAPYTTRNSAGELLESGQYVVFAEEGMADFKDFKTQMRQRSLFKVPTYEGRAVLEATFKPVNEIMADSAQRIDWSQAEILVGVSDVRGLQEDAALTASDGTVIKFEPASLSSGGTGQMDVLEVSKNYQGYNGLARQTDLKFMSVPARDVINMTDPFHVSVALQMSGAKRLGVWPFAKSTQAFVSADWPDPGFDGAFAPVSRTVTETGFDVSWSVPYLARGIAGEGAAHSLQLYDLSSNAMSVQFVATHSPYKTVNRALKYAVMFIGLVFIAYFLFEVIVGIRVHPAQYILIGLAQCVFYLLVLAFSERIGFTGAFVIAAGATIAVTSGYAGAVFKHKKYILQTGAVFTAVYVLLYVLMKVQDFALMIGALTSFMAVALTLYLTRNLDWYGADRPD